MATTQQVPTWGFVDATPGVAPAPQTLSPNVKAEGQVVAIVNGEEITLEELNSEIAGLNAPAGLDKNRIRNEVLQRMVESCLLAQAARDAGLDRDPDYIDQARGMRERRARERLLLTMYGKKTFDAVAIPDAGEVDRYISAHPTQFGDRRTYKLEQIIFDTPDDPKILQPLRPIHSMAGIVAWLYKQKIKFVHGNGAMDSANVPPDVMARIKALPAGEPFIVPNNGKIVVSVITATERTPMAADQARPLATQAIRREELQKRGEQMLKEAKAKARIGYQPGYEPPEFN